MAIGREACEELLELCWTAAEDGMAWLDREHLPSQLECFQPHPIESDGGLTAEAISAMIAQGLLTADGPRIQLSHAGRAQAQTIVRRHRLTEVLLDSVLDVSDASVESTACQAEHILNPEVTEAVCAFLGHPTTCPHGRSIPRSRCCEAALAPVEPLIVPLSRLAAGEDATVAVIQSARRAYLQRLGTLGVAPGRALRVRQTRPTLVVQLGATELALDREAGREILVRRRPSGASAERPRAAAGRRRWPWQGRKSRRMI